MNDIDVGQKARIRFVSEPDTDYTGRVTDLHRQVDQETREFEADIALDSLPGHWALGQRANVHVDLPQEPGRILVPLAFLDRREGRSGVWFAHDGHARWGAVTLGATAAGSARIKAGVQAGDILLRPTDRYEGEPVAPVLAEGSAP